jgi:hypothetical protein
VTADPKVPSLEELSARLVWESPVSTNANENYGVWNVGQDAWDYKHTFDVK